MKCFDGSSASEALGISIPAVGEMTAYILIFIFDTMMIDNYGDNLSLSAVGLSDEMYTLIYLSR